MGWSLRSRTPRPSRRKCRAKIKVARVEGLLLPVGAEDKRVAAVEVRWNGPESKARRVLYFGRKKRSRTTVRRISGERAVESDGLAVWNEGDGNQFENDCWFSGAAGNFPAWEVFLSVLYGSQQEGKYKALEEIGTAVINIAEWALQTPKNGELKWRESDLQILRKKIPITLRKDGLSCNGMLHVEFSLVEMRSFQETAETSVVTDDLKINKGSQLQGQTSDDSCFCDAQEGEEEDKPITRDSSNFTETTNSSSSSSSSAGSSPELQLRSSSMRQFFSWRKRTKNTNENSENQASPSSPNTSSDSRKQNKDSSKAAEEDDPIGSWEQRELISRDKQTKLKTHTFFASIDQRDETAGGESACTALVAVIADALHRNKVSPPTRLEFNQLIREGSLEWQKLCSNESYVELFPNKHFDLETILEAKVRPIFVVSEKSFIGFFQPESFESLKGAMPFEEIWDEITKDITESEMKVYIVSWNDHFFVLKLEASSYHIIDTLGERLFEGCRRAYMLEFDESTEMYKLPENTDDEEEMICRGKECCREFIKRFLAAIPLREELELEEKGKENGTTSTALHQRLQVEFHLTQGLQLPEIV